MKIRICMKTPDALDNAIEEEIASASEDEKEILKADALEIAEKWFKWNEIVTLEIDTDKKTCVVVPL